MQQSGGTIVKKFKKSDVYISSHVNKSDTTKYTIVLTNEMFQLLVSGNKELINHLISEKEKLNIGQTKSHRDDHDHEGDGV